MPIKSKQSAKICVHQLCLRSIFVHYRRAAARGACYENKLPYVISRKRSDREIPLQARRFHLPAVVGMT